MLLTVPHDTELEQYVLGCILYEPRCFAEIEDIFNPRFFYVPKHVAIAKAIQRIREGVSPARIFDEGR